MQFIVVSGCTCNTELMVLQLLISELFRFQLARITNEELEFQAMRDHIVVSNCVPLSVA